MISHIDLIKTRIFWGMITTEQTISVLKDKPPGRFLIRQWTNGIITIAIFLDDELIEFEVSDCTCLKSNRPFGKFNSVKELVNSYNEEFGYYILARPVKRVNPISLQELSKASVRYHIERINKNIPFHIRKELDNEFNYVHNHFKVAINGKFPNNIMLDQKKEKYHFQINTCKTVDIKLGYSFSYQSQVDRKNCPESSDCTVESCGISV